MMSAALHPQTVWYRIGWWVLVVIAGASIVNHVLGPFLGFASGDDQVLAFLALAAMNIYAVVVLLTGYRRGERWGWWVTWVFVAFYGLVFFYAPDVGSFYLGAAAVTAVAQLLTWSAFRQSDQVTRTD